MIRHAAPASSSASTDVLLRLGTVRSEATRHLSPEYLDDEGEPALRTSSDLHLLFKPRGPRTEAKIVPYAAQVQCASAPFVRPLSRRVPSCSNARARAAAVGAWGLVDGLLRSHIWLTPREGVTETLWA